MMRVSPRGLYRVCATGRAGKGMVGMRTEGRIDRRADVRRTGQSPEQSRARRLRRMFASRSGSPAGDARTTAGMCACLSCCCAGAAARARRRRWGCARNSWRRGRQCVRGRQVPVPNARGHECIAKEGLARVFSESRSCSFRRVVRLADCQTHQTLDAGSSTGGRPPNHGLECRGRLAANWKPRA